MPLKSGFDSAQDFPYESYSHMVYKVLYVNIFYSLLLLLSLLRSLSCKYCNIVLYVDLEFVFHENQMRDVS